ncbi:MAG: DNA mismatch repair endonuclease MutL [Clostridiales bacterium]|nr:DNA mismatch repair endonuclease MutL [Clostridiales bacterium]
MPKIELLDEQTIDKIAAGEVVERPSSVVKELVENAIDAKATAVTVEIRDGGTTLIRITDNGCGIEAEQIPVAFYRHSTSKIRKVEDLATISSLGFRGEALSSIASVSEVELITKTMGSLTGSRYQIEGGKEISLEEVGAPEGTTFLVKNLFYNTPARRKFLKSPQTEAGYISDMMEKIALSHPYISFKFINNGQIRLHTSGNSQVKDIIYHIYGRDIAANLLEVEGEFDGFSVSGFIGKPVISRGNRNFESYFINGRYIRSSLIAKAIEDGYRGFMMQHKYPFTVLAVSLNGKLVDVNVHPNKMELRFSNGEELYRGLVYLIQNALRQRELITDVAPGGEKKEAAKPVCKKNAVPEPFEKERISRMKEETAPAGRPKDAVLREPIRYGAAQEKAFGGAEAARETGNRTADVPKTQRPSADTPKPEIKERKQSLAEMPEQPRQQTLADYTAPETRLLSEEARPEQRIIGQLFDTYWLVEYEDRFYMIDQHAAHEKILFERTMKQYREKEFTSQMISPPIVLSLTMQEETLLKKYQEELEKLGFSIDSFGGKEYAVSAVPANLYGLNAQELLMELIDSLGTVSEKDTPDLVAEKIASMSCKAAVKGNNRLSRAEAEQMIADLLKLENPYFCPHGRPVIISMTKYEIEKKFKRIV